MQAHDENLAGSTFTQVNLAQARFTDVNLRGAEFHDVALAGARFDNVDLSGASITNARLDGATLAGHRLSDLLRAAAAATAPQLASSATLTLRRARDEDFPALQQMLELYQYELSDIWLQDADAQACYGYDLSAHRLGQQRHAHVALCGNQYAGFALAAPARVTRHEGCWMEQFFVLKRFQGSGTGRALALHTLQAHPGPWEVGQMAANTAAQAFWRRVLGDFTGGQFTEQLLSEGPWHGVVQVFEVPTAA